ncbi:hypothetical protein VBD025_16405 [Virgibacillus flavescens]|uniref:hypothetical protein n=1 Tax=Virgibacillus flavescens TaxID=1611422 RepID=UPI003D354F30
MKRLLNLNTVYIAATIIVLGAVLVPLAVESYNLRTQGINYFTTNIEDYYNNAQPVDGEHTIEIDLNNLKSNKEKVLFNDGENQIYVSKVIEHNTNEYELLFTSKGDYSLGGATLVSGLEYKYSKDSLISEFQARAKAVYSGDTYQLSPSEDSSDAEEFGFNLEFADDPLLDSEEERKIEVTVTNLYVNIWAEK